jgi:threonine dehydrogenase-like Zn-dependent dehydrogenase
MATQVAAQDTMREIVLPRGAHAPQLRRAHRPARAGAGAALARTLITGIDGTDEEVLAGGHGKMPAGQDHMVLGHECLAEVVEAPEESGLALGDRVVPLVRHGCGACDVCASAPDMCPDDSYREHGIKELDGFMREAWTDDASTLVKAPRELGDVAVLTEPLSIAVKAIDEALQMQRRIPWFRGFRGQRALVAGTGSLGILAALLLLDDGMEVTAMDLSPDDAAAPALLRRVGAKRHVNAKEERIEDVARDEGAFDLILEATGSAKVVFEVLPTLAGNGALAMLGVPSEKPPFAVEASEIMRNMVLRNQLAFGSVNSGKGHFRQAMEELGRLHERWPDELAQVLSHRYAPEQAREAFEAHGPEIVKKFIDWRSPTPPSPARRA